MQLGSGCAPSNRFAFVPARSHSAAVTLTTPPCGSGGESLREACGSGRRCSPRPDPGEPSTIRCSPDLVPSVGPSGAAWGSRSGLRVRATADLNYHAYRYHLYLASCVSVVLPVPWSMVDGIAYRFRVSVCSGPPATHATPHSPAHDTRSPNLSHLSSVLRTATGHTGRRSL